MKSFVWFISYQDHSTYEAKRNYHKLNGALICDVSTLAWFLFSFDYLPAIEVEDGFRTVLVTQGVSIRLITAS